MTTKNPWLGLASYEEPKNDGNDYLFCGRDEETLDVVRLIDNNLFITLYGSSGIGKTSLLRAGVIPILRRKDYFPLYVRLSQEPKEISYAEAIVCKLQNSGLTEEKGAVMEHLDGNDRLYLWNYFATTRFLKDDREVYPVIILDQFEEVFREGDKAKAELLLKQIYLLLNDELEMPNEAGYSADTNYRFVASIREDFLFVLEDSIDENSLDLYKNNRYRLRPMKPEQARQVVLVPGKDCIEEREKETIAKRIITLAKRPQSEDIDTLLLSIVCSGTYDKKMGDKIVFTDLAVWKNNPMEVYYQDAVKGLTAGQIRYIQQHLIREDGSRRRVDAEEVKGALGETTYRQLTQGKNHLFAIGDKGQVELLHDQLGMAVYEERKAFEERERKKKLKRRIWLIGSVVFLVMVLFLILLLIIGNQQEDLMRNQSRFVAEKAQSLLEENNPNLAELLCLEVFPKNLAHPERPYVPEIERILRETDVFHYANSINVHNAHIDVSNDGQYLLVYTQWDMALYDAQSFRCIRHWTSGGGIISVDDVMYEYRNGTNSRIIDTIADDEWTIQHVSLSCDNSAVAVACSDDNIRILDVETGNCQQVLNCVFPNVGYINLCFFSMDKTEIIAICDEGYSYNQSCSVIVWDLSSGEIKRTIEISDLDYPHVAISKDKKYMALGDKKLFVIDLETGQKHVCELMARPHAMAFTPDASKLFIGYYMDPMAFYDIKSGEFHEFLDISDITSISFNSDGKKILITQGRTVSVFDVFDGALISGFEIPDSKDSYQYQPKSACFGSNDTIVYLAFPKSVNLWHLKESYHFLKTSFHSWADVVFSPDGKQFLYIPEDTNVFCLYDTEKKLLLHTFDAFQQHENISFSPDGRYIASSSKEGTLLWDATTGECVKEMPSETIFAFCPDNKRMITGGTNDTIKIWSLDSGVCEKEIPLGESLNLDFMFCPDDKYIIIGDYFYSKLYIYNSRNGVFVNSMENPHLIDAVGSSDGRWLVTETETHLNIWSIRWGIGTCHHQIEIKEHSYPNGLSISPDNKYVSFNGHVYELLSGELVTDKPSFNKESSFSLEGKYLLNWGIIYEWETGVTVGSYMDHSSFCPTNNQIIATTSDGNIIFYDFPPLQDLIDQALERFKDRPLTDKERRIYYLE